MKSTLRFLGLALICSMLAVNSDAPNDEQERIKSVGDPLSENEFDRLAKALPDLGEVDLHGEWSDRNGVQNFDEVVPKLLDALGADREIKRLMDAAQELQQLSSEEHKEKASVVWNAMTGVMVRQFLNRQESIERIEWWNSSETGPLNLRTRIAGGNDDITVCSRAIVKLTDGMVAGYRRLAHSLEKVQSRFEQEAIVEQYNELMDVVRDLDQDFLITEMLSGISQLTTECNTKYSKQKQLEHLIGQLHGKPLSS